MIVTLRLLIVPLVAALTLSGCGEEPSASAPADGGALTLDWPDLLPEGEEARLDEIYTDFYRDLEARMTQRQVPLSMAGSMDAPIDAIEEGSPLDEMPQLGTFNAVPELDGQRVRLPGFVVPLDYSAGGEIENFLLVPYFGACIHTPPPPPNQIVYVEGQTEISTDDIWMPFWAVGTLTTQKNENDIGDAAYTMVLDRLDIYDE